MMNNLATVAFIWFVANPIGIVSKGASMMIAWNLTVTHIGAPRLSFMTGCLVSLFIGKIFVNSVHAIDTDEDDGISEIAKKCIAIEIRRWAFTGMICLVALLA